jgi:hypothetical protein
MAAGMSDGKSFQYSKQQSAISAVAALETLSHSGLGVWQEELERLMWAASSTTVQRGAEGRQMAYVLLPVEMQTVAICSVVPHGLLFASLRTAPG